MHKLPLFLLLAYLWLPLPSHAYDLFSELQSGALMGDLHLSYGLTWHDRHSLMAGMGFVASRSNHSGMKLFSAQYQYHAPYRIEIGTVIWQPFHFGIGFLKSDHKDLFTTLPDQYPYRYYPPSALHFLFNYQSRVQINKHWQASFNISTMDVALISYVRQSDYYQENYDFFGLNGITAWGFGVRYDF
jgi:hypothetical protein